jgi:hypothetical protein
MSASIINGIWRTAIKRLESKKIQRTSASSCLGGFKNAFKRFMVSSSPSIPKPPLWSLSGFRRPKDSADSSPLPDLL